MRALISQGFYVVEHGETRELRGITGWSGEYPEVPVWRREAGGRREGVGRYYYVVTCSKLQTTRQIFRTLF